MTQPAPRSHLILPAVALLIAALALAACGSGEEVDPGNAADAPDYSRLTEDSPPALAQLYANGGVLLGGGLDGYDAQLAKLDGHPVVVNKWASWCGPCRVEFPYFQDQVAKRGDQVGFVGVNSEDSDAAAETFLRDHPIPYPSISDPDSEIARSIDAGVEFPATAFYDAAGERVYVHRGVYASEQDLAADIDRYASG